MTGVVFDLAFAWQGSRAACGRRSHALNNPKLTRREPSSPFFDACRMNQKSSRAIKKSRGVNEGRHEEENSVDGEDPRSSFTSP
jgi:hypothetical protein